MMITHSNRKTFITVFLSALMAFVLCGCRGDGISDTYWRDDKTGDWLIGLTEDKVVYDCKVWDIAKMDESDGAYIIQAKYGMNSLDISFGSEQNGKRNITIGDKQFDCSLIDNDWYMPDYPEKDTCTTIADNHYFEGDSVTIIGWIRPLPAIVNWLKNKIEDNAEKGNEVVVKMMANILTGEEPSFTAPIDSDGHFVLRMPIENTTFFYLDCDLWSVRVVAEPNETYFLMIDPQKKKKLFMGKNARLQNEVNAHNVSIKSYGIDTLEKMGSVMDILESVKIQTAESMQDLDEVCRQHPTLSERYRVFYRNKILTNYAHILTQGMYLAPNYEVPEAYSKVVEENYWKELSEPYSMDAYEFTRFFNDYRFRLEDAARDKIVYSMKWIMDQAEKDGIINLSAKDWDAIRQYDEAFPTYWEKRESTPDSLQEAIDD